MLPLSNKEAADLGLIVRRNKHNAEACMVDGIRFASKLEAKRYCELKVLERQGLIKNLEDHHRWPLRVSGTVIGHYESDFAYTDAVSGEPVDEDTKGFQTDLNRWKLKHFEAQYGRAVRLVYQQPKRRKR